MCEHIVRRIGDVGVANLTTRQPPVSTAPGRGGSKPPAAAQPLNIHRTARLRGFREAKSLPYQAWAYELPYHHLQIVYSRNRRAEELSGIANTADLLYTYFKGNLCPVQGPSDSGVSQAYHFIECHHQHPAGGDDGSKQWGGIPLLHYRCQSYT